MPHDDNHHDVQHDPDRHDPDRHDFIACTETWQALRRAHDRVARRLTADLARECALAINDVDALLYLRTHAARPVRCADLLDAVPLSQPALSRLVARLAARGLVTKSEAADDGRAALVSLTERGSTLLDRAAEVHARAVHETLTSRFSATEQAALLRTLSQIDA